MKCILSRIAVMIILAIGFSSCKKERLAPASSYSSAADPSTLNIYLAANDWINYPNQVYVSIFKGVIAQPNASGDRIVTTYVDQGGTDVQISNRHIWYNGNELWATNSATDVSITYRCISGVPLKSLNIRVEVR